MSAELKALIEAGNRAFEEFKAKNDQRLTEIAAKGEATGETKAAVEKVNASLTEIQAKIAEIQSAQRAAEASAARINAGGDVKEQAVERGHAQAFFAQVRGQPMKDVNVGDSDLDVYRAYRSAFFAFMVGGKSAGHEVQAALSVGTDPSGGLWVPPDTTGRIIELVRESSPIRQIASVDSIMSDTLEGYNDLGEADSGWVGETAAREETDTPDLGAWKIPLHEQYAKPRTTQKLLDTSVRDPEGWLTRKVADKIARTENTAFVTGDGVKRPRGFTTYAHGVPSASIWGVIEQIASGAASAFKADKLIDVPLSLKASLRTNARWVGSRMTFAEIRKLKDGNGNYLWQPNFQAGSPGALQGYPITEVEAMDAVSAGTLPLGFGDFRAGYQVVDHTTGLRVLRDPFTAKPWVVFYTTKYTGGGVIDFDAIKLVKIGTSV